MAKINPHNHPTKLETFFKGANNTVEPESNEESLDGYYHDSENFIVVTDNGVATAAVKVAGETVLYEIPSLATEAWTCLWFGVVRTRLVCIWAHNTGTELSAVSVDNQVVLQSGDFPVEVSSILQVHMDESCGEGEIFVAVTNKSVPPFYLDIGDMITSTIEGSQKYFDDFVFQNYTVNFSSPADHPIITGLVNVGSGNGLPVGKYSYQIRYVDASGNEANPSYPTPLVFVPRRIELDSTSNAVAQNNYHPAIKNYGNDADPEASTQYGVNIKFRVTNLVGYESIQIIRNAYDTGAGLGFSPTKKLIKTIPIGIDEISIVEFTDSLSSQDTPIDLTINDTVGDALEIESAKAIRYFDRKVELGNVTYKKLNEGDVEFILEGNNPKIFHVSKELGRLGHGDPLKESYQKTLMHSEKYSWGLLGIPSNLQNIFVQPIRDDVQVPSRREELSTEEALWSDSPVQAATVDGGVGNTFEIFDLEGASAPVNNAAGWNIRDGEPYPYKPFSPISVDDPENDFDSRRIEKMYLDESFSTSFLYNPYGFNMGWHSTAMALAGLASYPSWLKAFSLVKRRPAGRVAIQGLLTYKLEENGTSATQECTKVLDEAWFFSPDLESGIVDASVVAALENAQSGEFKAELVSPLGFFSDIYNAHEHGGGGKNDSAIDMMCFARVLKDKLSQGMNFEAPGDNYPGIPDGVTPHDQQGFVAYGNWRNDTTNPLFPSNGNGDSLIDIESFSKEILEEGVPRWTIKFTNNIYLATTPDKGFETLQGKRFHEPWYIVNIILDGAENGSQNIQDYLPSEHYQKIESIVGRSSGGQNEVFEVVDERWEDFHTEADAPHNIVKAVYVDSGDGNKRRYVNINILTPVEIVQVNADIASGSTLFDGSRIYGKFASTRVSLLFGSDNNATTLSTGDLVYVLYDNRMPCIAYGDAVNGNGLGVKIHKKKESATSWDADGQFRLNCAYPYFGWDKPLDMHYVRRTSASGIGSNLEPDSHTYALSRVRQMLVSYPVTTRTAIQLAYREHFPLVNYIQRPNRYDDTQTPSDQGIYAEYEDDFPNEIDRWLYGGFRFTQVPVNQDYSQRLLSPALVSRPSVGFNENNEFCTRLIWSLPRPINVSLAPGLRTFPATNFYDLDDRKGAIKFLWDSLSDTRNLYAFTDDDVALLITDSRQITSLDGQSLLIQGETEGSNFVTEEEFLGLQGMPSLYWRSAAESKNGVFFINPEGAFFMEGNSLKPIGDVFYKKTLYEDFALPYINGGSVDFTSLYDTRLRQYWAAILNGQYTNAFTLTEAPPEIPIISAANINQIRCLDVANGLLFANIGINNMPTEFTGSTCFCNISNQSINLYQFEASVNEGLIGTIPPNSCVSLQYINNQWTLEDDPTCNTCSKSISTKLINYATGIDNFQGTLSYAFDKYASKESSVYGARNGKIYSLYSGTEINGLPRKGRLRVACTPKGSVNKEFVMVMLNSNRRPSKIRIYNRAWDTVLCEIISSQLKKYSDSYWQYIPREVLTRNRIQGTAVNIEIFDEDPRNLQLKSIEVVYKDLK